MARSRRRLFGAVLTISTLALAACGAMPGGGSSSGGSGNYSSGATATATKGTAVTARLSGAAEVPPVTTEASGSFEGSFDTATSLLRYKVSYSGLSGPATAAHIHGPAMAGQNAGVVIPFASAASPISGQATLTAAQAADLMAGRLYVNVHTAANPGGELRGQLQPTGSGASSATGGSAAPAPAPAPRPGGY